MDLQHLRASDGTGEAVLAHIQTVRNPGSTVLDLDNVDNWNTKAVIITGTPAANGFVSPVGMKVMYGHLSAGDFIIDGYAPGYVDNGNLTTEVAIVKMCTAWADVLIDLLDNSLQDNGLLKTTSLDHFYKPLEITPTGFVTSGGIVAVSAGLITTMSNIVYYIGGLRYTKSAIANRTWGASKDGYADIDTAGNITYIEVANGAASPALTANSIRIAKVVTSGAAVTSITQVGADSLFNPIRLSRPAPLGSDKLMRLDQVPVKQGNATVTVMGDMLIQTGWAWGLGDGASATALAQMNFPVPFAEPPMLSVSTLGYKNTTNPVNSADFNSGAGFYITAVPTADGVGILANIISRDAATNNNASVRHGYSWIAIGRKA